jgi:hypothetical protein
MQNLAVNGRTYLGLILTVPGVDQTRAYQVADTRSRW